MNPYLVACPRCKAPELHPCMVPARDGMVAPSKRVCVSRFVSVCKAWHAMTKESEARQREIDNARRAMARAEIRRQVKEGVL